MMYCHLLQTGRYRKLISDEYDINKIVSKIDTIYGQVKK